MPKARPAIIYIGRARYPDGQRSVTFAIASRQYEYFLSPQHCDTVEFLCRKINHGKALAFAKKHATQTVQPIRTTSATSMSSTAGFG